MATKVLAVAQSATLGGAELGLLRIARRLPDLGFDVELAVPGRGTLRDAAQRYGIPLHTVPVGPLRKGAWPLAVPSWPRAQRLVRRIRPALVWLNGSVTHRLVPGFPGTTLVPHLHDLVEEPPRPWHHNRFWNEVPVMLCDSDAVARSAAAFGAPADRLRTVYCPVEPADPAPRPEWAGGGPVIGYVGRIEPRKGTSDLLQAGRKLFDRRPDARIVLVGDDELSASRRYARGVHEQARELGDRVISLGRVEEAHRLMPWFDVLCVPSRREPFGTVAAEALAAGTPVVATRSGGMEEYVVPGRNGELVAPGEPDALAAALDAVLERAGEMQEAARADAERFATERVAHDVADAFRHAADPR